MARSFPPWLEFLGFGPRQSKHSIIGRPAPDSRALVAPPEAAQINPCRILSCWAKGTGRLLPVLLVFSHTALR